MQNVFWSSNLKFLRSRREWSQEKLAKSLSITRSKLNAHENGQTKNPSIDDLLLFSTFFKIPIDTLIKVDLNKLSAYNLHQLEQGERIYIQGQQMRILALNVDVENEELHDYIPIEAKAGYSTGGFSDPSYIAELPKFVLPQLPTMGTFRMFPIKGDSMLPIPHGSDVIASYLENWEDLKKPTLGIAILGGTEDIVFKKIQLIEEKKAFKMHSLNALYDDYYVPVEEVNEIWTFYAYITQSIPEGETELKQILHRIDALERKLDK